ncbi:MAG: GNAT family N-acetyltransferase [candidate division Zixibacteria bacterium]|nr:GNAT family N-acetyltransferase [candidate division Zixibacteria bacterium]
MQKYIIYKTNISNDKKIILNFWENNFPGWPRSKFDLFYINNPFGESMCWLARELSVKKPVGSTALFPRFMYINGQKLIAGLSGDLAVEKNHRKQGIAFKLREATIDFFNNSAIDFLYATPNEVSARVLKKVNYKFLGKIRRRVKILRSYKLIQRIIKFKLLAKIISKIIDPIFSIFFGGYRIWGNSDFDFEFPLTFDARFDTLWKEAIKNYTIIGDRSPLALTWRFFQNHFKDFKIFTVAKKNTSELIGYIIYRIDENDIYIVDLLTIDKSKYFNLLLAYFSQFIKKQGYDSITINFFGDDIIKKQLSNSGFIAREKHISVALYFNDDFPYKDIIIDKNNWYYCDMDNDVEA